MPEWPSPTRRGASHLPFGILRGYAGTDLTPHTTVQFIECPFTGETLAAVKAIHPVSPSFMRKRPTRKGNVLLWGIVGAQKEAVMAAERAIVTVEEIVDNLKAPPSLQVILPTWILSAVAVTESTELFPPTPHGYYPRSNAFYKQWDAHPSKETATRSSRGSTSTS